MPNSLLKHGQMQLIKHVIKFNVLLTAFYLSNGFADTTLYIGSMQSHEQTISKKVLKVAYQTLNQHIEFIILPAERALRASNSGMLDGEDSRIAGLEKLYPNLICIPVPIETVKLFAYSKNMAIPINNWQSIKPYRLAYLRGVKAIERNTVDFKITDVTDIKQAFMMLEHNRVDIVITDEFQADNNLVDFPNIKKLEPAIYTFPVFHYLNKKHQQLVPKLEAILIKMQKDGTMQQIIQSSE